VVRRLIAGGRFRVRSVLLTRAALPGLREALGRLPAGAPVYLASARTVRQLAGFNFHRGCLAVGERGGGASPDALLVGARPGPQRLLALEAVANPDNVGGVFRSAMALGADGVLLSPGCADPLYRKAIRVSVGGTLTVPFARASDWPASLRRLRDAGFTLVALTTRRDALDVSELGRTRPIPARTALLLGNEGDGLSAGARAAADLEVTIPMAPGADSLNVATAAGIALHRLGLAAR
jgi:tRNA G18 (ribose-2'-O)-methylase SpoU